MELRRANKTAPFLREVGRVMDPSKLTFHCTTSIARRGMNVKHSVRPPRSPHRPGLSARRGRGRAGFSGHLLLLVVFGDVDNLGTTVADSENCPIRPINPKRIEPNGFGLEFFGVQARVRRVSLKERLLFRKFFLQARPLELLSDARVKRLYPHRRGNA